MMSSTAAALISSLLYGVARPALFRQRAADAHALTLKALAWADDHPLGQKFCQWWGSAAHVHQPLLVGGVRLPNPLMLAAGFVKGAGFADEGAALRAVEHGENVMPGWNAMPLLVGAVEFGSFTRWPRLGNAGEVLWRDVTTRSTQNRVGLKNPGARAAAAFLAARRGRLPPVWGINIAVSPGVTNETEEEAEIVQAVTCFTSAGITPSWFTLNLSCPNTEDDPRGVQTEARTRRLSAVFVSAAGGVPCWVKISPDLGEAQYRTLLCACADTGVQAIIATNTLAQPAPNDPFSIAGVGGGRLRPHALAAVRSLASAASEMGIAIDIVASGGILDGATWRAYQNAGAAAGQYWSALVYRGPLASTIILKDIY